MKRLIGAVSVVLALAASVLVGTTSPAGAAASGCSAWGNMGTVRGFPVYRGTECVTMSGQGRFVEAVGASFASAGNVCNWNITAEFFDGAGRWYQTYTGPTHWNCQRNGNDTIWIARYMQRGFMCSTLKMNGARLTSVCHSIY